ncbi:quinoprotein relay system zinc metallohydrolase 1 [Methyloversatilis thermotolerans]|uniref:quinoprotein relay system zinc metallohydrolase 1 n=1 Tax=Methyloversatilis thermotolerans TaxID=1346290 RepID=UPI00037D23C0|nr:quinoprotein relay system zinc metallohydrolase 1 [Methyloversatilis thermotolerans]
MSARVLLIACALLCACGVRAQAGLDYGLTPERIAEDTWVVVGRSEDITRGNGGNISNSAFIVTRDGVVVIDTGATRRYGQQLRAAIARVTPRPVIRVYNTHHHPDHFLGNQAFADAPLLALPATRAGQRDDGNAFSDNVYRMAGDWASGTEALVASQDARAGSEDVGGHRLELLALHGHTAGDLVLVDRTTGVLFAGDLVFLDRAPTTPHAHIADWLAALDRIAAVRARRIVPGHGPVHDGLRGVEQTRDWLRWLDATLRDAAERGLDMAEVMRLPMPEGLAGLPLARSEYERSVSHLYPGYEEDAFRHRAAADGQSVQQK